MGPSPPKPPRMPPSSGPRYMDVEMGCWRKKPARMGWCRGTPVMPVMGSARPSGGPPFVCMVSTGGHTTRKPMRSSGVVDVFTWSWPEP